MQYISKIYQLKQYSSLEFPDLARLVIFLYSNIFCKKIPNKIKFYTIRNNKKNQKIIK